MPTDNYVADDRVNKNDGQAVLSDPMIEVVSSIESTSLVKTWQQYSLQPQVELDKIEFRSFGVYNLSMTASDYHGDASCDGCVAVVDTYPPHALQSCATTAWGSPESTPADLTSANLQAAIAKEASFSAFSSAQNVVNYGPSERVDIAIRTIRDWLDSSYVALSSDSSSCFHDFAVRDLLLQSSSTENPLALSSTALSSLQCMRCCSKQTTLREYYYDYKCGTSSDAAAKLIAGTESCSFNHCMRVPSSALVQASASSTDATSLSSPLVISRNSSCAALSASCSYSATLTSLVSTTAAWSAELPNQGNYLRGFNVSVYVFWRYKKDSSDWALWDVTAVLEFTTSSTTLAVQAWTRCGMVKQFDFVVAVSSSPTLLLPSVAQARSGTPSSMNLYLTSITAVPASCSSNEAMSGFRLYSSGGSNAYYTAQCVALKSVEWCDENHGLDVCP